MHGLYSLGMMARSFSGNDGDLLQTQLPRCTQGPTLHPGLMLAMVSLFCTCIKTQFASSLLTSHHQVRPHETLERNGLWGITEVPLPAWLVTCWLTLAKLTYLNLSFFICELEIIMPTTQRFCWEQLLCTHTHKTSHDLSLSPLIQQMSIGNLLYAKPLRCTAEQKIRCVSGIYSLVGGDRL